MPTKNWQRFAERYRDDVIEIRQEVAEVSGAVGSVFASAWYHANPANERGPIVYG